MSLARQKMLALGAGALLAAGGTGAALALASNDSGSPPHHKAGTHTSRTVAHPTANVNAAFAALRRPARLTTRQRHERHALRHQFSRHAARLTPADYAAARPVPIRGSSDDAWIAPSGDRVCVFLPDPVDGFGVSCVSLAGAEAGRGVGILTPQAGSGDKHIRVAIIVPDGAAAPDVIAADGTDSTLPVVNNVAAAVLSPSAAKLQTAAGTLNLALMMNKRPDLSCMEKAARAGSGPTNCPLK